MSDESPPIGLTEELPPGTECSLAGIELLKDQDEATIALLESVAAWRFCPKDGIVFDRDDTSGDVFFVVSGRVRALDSADTGQEVAFIDVDAGNIVGELSALDGEARSSGLTALDDTVLALVPRDVFMKFVEANPDITLRLMEHFVRTIRSLNGRVIDLSSTTVLQRVYESILEIAQPDPTNRYRLIIETMPRHKEIAVWAGTTPDTVARAVGRLLESNVAKRHLRSLHILDPDRLRALVDAT